MGVHERSQGVNSERANWQQENERLDDDLDACIIDVLRAKLAHSKAQPVHLWYSHFQNLWLSISQCSKGRSAN
jgi:hypothetical protein